MTSDIAKSPWFSNFAIILCRLPHFDGNPRRCTAEASSLGHTAAVRNLREWVEGFVARASEGLFEREALLARCGAIPWHVLKIVVRVMGQGQVWGFQESNGDVRKP